MPSSHSSIKHWTHPSVRQLAPAADPIAVMVERMRSLVLEAQEQGWEGPPFDPVELAARLRIRVIPRQDIPDAQTVPLKGGRLQIEFNPERPHGRVRYSIAHEIAHTLFPDCAERVRNRVASTEIQADEWQLEMLCNIGAAEILMPVGSFPHLRQEDLGIDRLMSFRREFDVSSEALLIRAVKLTDRPCAMFAASRVETGKGAGRYRMEYSFTSRSWPGRAPSASVLPLDSVVTECTAIGFTAKGEEKWTPITEALHVECVGIPPYPGSRFPRVVGVAIVPSEESCDFAAIRYVKGDALEPRGKGDRIVAHVANGRTPRWGGGFALEVRKKWKHVQDDFCEWAQQERDNLSLGNVRVCPVDDEVSVCSMVAQHGYGPSPTPRIRYNALEACLRKLAEKALEADATVHMPRIGCGQAGGLWGIVSELVEDALCNQAVEVTVYDLPGRTEPMQGSLFPRK